MNSETIVERIKKLSASQISRSVELLMSRLTQTYQKQIPAETLELVKAFDLTQVSNKLNETFEAQGYSLKTEIIQTVVEKEETRIEISREILIILAELPETRQLVETVVNSVEEEMFAAEILATGVAGSMLILSVSIFMAVGRMRPEDLPKTVKKICDAIIKIAPKTTIEDPVKSPVAK